MSNHQANQVAIVAVLFMVVPGVVVAQSTTCNTCADCETKLNSGSFTTVYLASDIDSQTGSCVWVVSQNDVEFDCAGHTIDGDDSGIDYGVAVLFGTGNEVRNCTVTDFDTGIMLWGTTDLLVINNSTSSNTYGIQIGSNASSNIVRENWSFDNNTGIRIMDSTSNTLNSNDSCSNSLTDIEVGGTSTGNTGNGNRCDAVAGWPRCSPSCSRPTLEQLYACKDMRLVGGALMSWLTDQVSKSGRLANSLKATYDLSVLDVLSVYDITEMLQPIYWFDRPIPAVDPWGMPYEYRLNANLLASRVIAIRSPGADARLEGPVYTVQVLPTEANDLVWADGYWVGWPSSDCGSFFFGDGFESSGSTMWSLTRP